MSLRRRFIWGVLLSALVASWAYYAEYLPFTGKWIAAYRLEQYAKEQYPGFRQGKVYFNPCGGPYETTYTGDSGQEVELGCGYDGLIGDPLRAERWMQNNHISKVMWALNRLEQGSYGNVSCQWRYDMPGAAGICIDGADQRVGDRSVSGIRDGPPGENGSSAGQLLGRTARDGSGRI